jgi:putative nucleotidyltransferase with HDIG domain
MSSIESAARRLPPEKPPASDSGDEVSSTGTQQQYQYLRTRTVQISTLANVLILVLTGFVAGFVLLSDSSVIDSHLSSQSGVPVRFLLLAFWVLACLSVAYIMRSQIHLERMKEDVFEQQAQLHHTELYVHELDKLLEACRAIHEEKDPERILHGILDTTIRAFQLDECSILLSDPSTNRFRVYNLSTLGGTGTPGSEASRMERNDVDAALTGEEGRLLPGSLDGPGARQGAEGGRAVSTAISVPLFLRNELIGVLNADKRRSGGRFDAHQLKLLYIFASQVAVSLENIRLHENLKEKLLNAVSTLAMALEAKDAYTRGHSQRVSHYSVQIARELGLHEREIEAIRLAGILHDIGKIGIRDEILHKAGRLTEEEWKQIRKHPEVSVSILSRIPDLKGILKIIRHHHEHYNGKGYPSGLAGEQIPLGARILSVTDMLDALISDRPYREKITFMEAVEEIRKVSGTQLDPRIVEALDRIVESLSLDPSDILVPAAVA